VGQQNRSTLGDRDRPEFRSNRRKAPNGQRQADNPLYVIVGDAAIVIGGSSFSTRLSIGEAD
jgi:hypothetical protein